MLSTLSWEKDIDLPFDRHLMPKTHRIFLRVLCETNGLCNERHAFYAEYFFQDEVRVANAVSVLQAGICQSKQAAQSSSLLTCQSSQRLYRQDNLPTS